MLSPWFVLKIICTSTYYNSRFGNSRLKSNFYFSVYDSHGSTKILLQIIVVRNACVTYAFDQMGKYGINAQNLTVKIDLKLCRHTVSLEVLDMPFDTITCVAVGPY